MLDFLSVFGIMLSYIVLVLHLFIFAYAFFISLIAFKKFCFFEKYKNNMFCVYWYLCTFGWPLKQGFLTLYLS